MVVFVFVQTIYGCDDVSIDVVEASDENEAFERVEECLQHNFGNGVLVEKNAFDKALNGYQREQKNG